jgi:hypothetical protein
MAKPSIKDTLPEATDQEVILIETYLNKRKEQGYTEVQVDPTLGTLMSMAIRSDHALMVDGYYDGLPAFIEQSPKHATMVENAIREMRKLYEEVVGKGFYDEGREDFYKAIYFKAIERRT